MDYVKGNSGARWSFDEFGMLLFITGTGTGFKATASIPPSEFGALMIPEDINSQGRVSRVSTTSFRAQSIHDNPIVAVWGYF